MHFAKFIMIYSRKRFISRDMNEQTSADMTSRYYHTSKFDIKSFIIFQLFD